MADLTSGCDGTLVSGEEGLRRREANGRYRSAAMSLPHVLDGLFEGASW